MSAVIYFSIMNHQAEQLQNRLINFSTDVIKVSRAISRDRIGEYLSGQLYRSGTSPSLNYAEAQSAESRADFIHKMKIALKELRETYACLKIIKGSFKLSNIDLDPLIEENNELISIFVQSINTASSRSVKK